MIAVLPSLRRRRGRRRSTPDPATRTQQRGQCAPEIERLGDIIDGLIAENGELLAELSTAHTQIARLKADLEVWHTIDRQRTGHADLVACRDAVTRPLGTVRARSVSPVHGLEMLPVWSGR